MKKLNQILLSNYIYLFLFIFSIIFILFFTKIVKYESKFSGKETKIIGIVNDIVEKEKYIKIEIKSKEKVEVYYYNFDRKFNIGDKVLFYGNFELPKNNTNFNQFNYKNYLYNKKIYYIFKSKSCNIISNSKNIFYKLKNFLFKKVEKSSQKEYLSTFILGKNILDEEVKNMYAELGVSHLMAISGMHISFFISTLIFILRKFKFKKNMVSIMIIFFLLFYMFFIGYSGSVVRCGSFFIVNELLRIAKIDICAIKRFFLSIFFVILINPFVVYNLGFIYSSIISLYLILFNNSIKKRKHFFSKTFEISVISFLASMPISIYNYFQISPISILFNLVCVPYVSFVLFPLSILSFLFSSFDFFIKFFSNLYEFMCSIFTRFNLILVFKKPDLCLIIIYYFIITLLLTSNGKKKAVYVVILFCFLIVHYNYNYIFKTKFVIAFDVGQGDSILLNSAGNSILIDTGGNLYSSYSFNKSISSTLIHTLNSFGIKKIKYLLLSHGDFDHMGEAINLVNNFKVEKVIFNCGEYNDLEKELIKVLDKKKIKYYSCIKELNIDNNKLYFLQTKKYDNENDNSNVIYTDLNGHKFMFMGDASSTTEKEILDKYNLPDIDILKVGHHGSRTSSGKEFIDEIKPKYSVISVGKNNRYGHPNKEVLENLNNSKIYRTDEDGSIIFKIKNNKLKIETCSP